MWQVVVLVALFIALVAAGLLFVNQSLYKDFDGKDPVAQVTCGREFDALSIQVSCCVM